MKKKDISRKISSRIWISRIADCGPRNTNQVKHPHKRTENLISKHLKKRNMKKNVINRGYINCYVDRVYIGQTDRSFKKRVDEHKQSFMVNLIQNMRNMSLKK